MTQTNEQIIERAAKLDKVRQRLTEELPFLEFKVKRESKYYDVVVTITASPEWIRRFPAVDYKNYNDSFPDDLPPYEQMVRQGVKAVVVNSFLHDKSVIKIRLGYKYLTKKSLEEDFLMYKLGMNLD